MGNSLLTGLVHLGREDCCQTCPPKSSVLPWIPWLCPHFCTWKRSVPFFAGQLGIFNKAGKLVCYTGPSLVIDICVSGWHCNEFFWREYPEPGAKLLWSSRSNLRYYSGSSFLLAILRFWRLHLQLESALTLLQLKILLFHQSYFCRAARGCTFPEKAFYHERHPTQRLLMSCLRKKAVFSGFSASSICIV